MENFILHSKSFFFLKGLTAQKIEINKETETVSIDFAEPLKVGTGSLNLEIQWNHQ